MNEFDPFPVRQDGRVAVRPLEGFGSPAEAFASPLMADGCGPEDGRPSNDRPEKRPSPSGEQRGTSGIGGFESRPHRHLPTVEEIKERLSTDWRWVSRGIVVLYEHQTADEQQVGVTNKHNGVGFNNADSFILTSFAKQILGLEHLDSRTGRLVTNPPKQLTEKQLALAFHAMPKYAKQLHKVAIRKQEQA